MVIIVLLSVGELHCASQLFYVCDYSVYVGSLPLYGAKVLDFFTTSSFGSSANPHHSQRKCLCNTMENLLNLLSKTIITRWCTWTLQSVHNVPLIAVLNVSISTRHTEFDGVFENITPVQSQN